MYRIRFHGRGGQGVKTAGRMLGTAFFQAGWEVQDAPLYGAERRGAPVFAYVRADRGPILERGVIHRADLVVVADEGLIAVPAAAVLKGVDARTVLLILGDTPAETWRRRLNFPGRLLTRPSSPGEVPASATCVGAAARLVGVLDPQHLQQAIRQELGAYPQPLIERNMEEALSAYGELAALAGVVEEGGAVAATGYAAPDWIDLPRDSAATAAPAIHRPLTSLRTRTGLWRTLKPVIDYERCNKCWWVCSAFCPDGAIAVDDAGNPQIDYLHCKGCMICVAQCPPHAIAAVAEQEAAA